MKKSAIIRIVVLLTALVLLLTVLIIGISRTPAELFSFHWGEEEDLLPAVMGSDTAVPAEGIRELEINWASGDVTIAPGDTDQILFSSTPSEKYPTAYRVKEQELIIQFSDNMSLFAGAPEKNLVITVPRDWVAEEINLDAASTTFTVTGITVRDLDIDGASNTCRMTDVSVDSLDIDGASNSLEFSGSIRELENDGVSAVIEAVFDNCPQRIESDGVSGRISLTYPENSGFTITMDGVNSRLRSDFDLEQIGDSKRFGDGRCIIDIDGVSGELNIFKAS